MRKITIHDLLGTIRILKTSVLVTKTPLTTLKSLLEATILMNLGRTNVPIGKMWYNLINIMSKLHESASPIEQVNAVSTELNISNPCFQRLMR